MEYEDVKLQYEADDGKEMLVGPEEQGGGNALDITFEETVETVWNIIRNDSYIHLIHSNIRALNAELLQQQFKINELWQHVTTTATTTTTSATTTAIYTDLDSHINAQINHLLNLLKKIQIEHPGLSFDLSFPVGEGEYFLYTHDKALNKEINAIFTRLNAIIYSYNLDPKIFDHFFRSELNFYHWDTKLVSKYLPSSEFKVESKILPEAFTSPDDSQAVIKASIVASIVTSIVLMPVLWIVLKLC